MTGYGACCALGFLGVAVQIAAAAAAAAGGRAGGAPDDDRPFVPCRTDRPGRRMSGRHAAPPSGLGEERGLR